MQNEKPPFFVVGNDRSGTTVLRLVLDRSREAAVPPESMFLLDFAPIRRRGGLDDPERASRFVARVWAHPRVRLWNLPAGAPPVPAGLGHAAAYRFAVEAPFRAYAARERKPRFGDKTPAYLHAVDELVAVWPDARIVVLVRDARDVALSIRRMPFGPNNVYAAARWWALGIRAGLAAERRHPEQVLRLRYEDLVADPARHVRRVCEHIGLGYNSDMLAIERTEPGKIVESQAAWFPKLAGGISSEAGRWRSEMSKSDRCLVAAVAGAELEALGYDPGVRPRPVNRALSLSYTAHDGAVRAANAFRVRVVRERGRELRHVLRRKMFGACP